MAEAGWVLSQARNEIRAFQAETKWYLSASARSILEDALLAILTDDLPSRERRGAPAASSLAIDAVQELPKFLYVLLEQATRDPDMRRHKQIGAIFLLSHLNRFSLLKNCTCWPE
jgi:hypothetical protein